MFYLCVYLCTFVCLYAYVCAGAHSQKRLLDSLELEL